MSEIKINTSNITGKIKPMHAVNNGPVYKFGEAQRITNIEAYKAAGIPYARTHDSSFNSTYGGPHTVDINAIFPDFDKDPYDENSYDFVMTDEYLRVIDFAGTKPFYRLGAAIEHGIKKYNTMPPKDFHKWAVICEHIIRHYNEGWANGFHYNIEYWEIWNEPDINADDSDNKLCWGGTAAQFYKLYNITAKHLKSNFPNLKIGGPAVTEVEDGDSIFPWKVDWVDNFLKSIEVKPDFFSWHCYPNDVNYMVSKVRKTRKVLDSYGLQDTESILDEWNYVKGWCGDEWLYSLRQEKGIKGAAFIASAMCSCQYEPLDMLMYYDARPCGMNGMFNTDFVCDCLKGYYPFRMFNELYKLKNCVKAESDNVNIKACAAVSEDGENAAVMISYFDDNDNAPQEKIELDINGLPDLTNVQIYILDETHDMELIRSEKIVGEKLSLDMPLFTTYLIKLSK